MKLDTASSPSDRAPKLLTQVVNAIRIWHYSIRTEEAYVHWVKAYIRFHGLRHPRDMGAREVTKFLSHLASERDVAAATQQQALLFLYRHVLEIDLPWLDDLVRPKKPARLPTVLNHDEIARLLAVVRPEQSLMVRLLYGTGMRLMECLRLRVKDVDFVRGEILIRDGKGAKDRVTVLPRSLVEPLQGPFQVARRFFDQDRAGSRPGVYLPHALERKYPNAGATWARGDVAAGCDLICSLIYQQGSRVKCPSFPTLGTTLRHVLLRLPAWLAPHLAAQFPGLEEACPALHPGQSG